MTILVDTSVWVDFLRSGDTDLEKCLEDERVVMHSMVLGELSLGYLRNRMSVLTFLGDLPQISSATHEQVMAFVDTHLLAGRGIGWVDAHLLTAVARVDETQFWTRAKTLLKKLNGISTMLNLKRMRWNWSAFSSPVAICKCCKILSSSQVFRSRC